MFLSGVPYSHFSAHDFIAISCVLGQVGDWHSTMRQEVRNMFEVPPPYHYARLS